MNETLKHKTKNQQERDLSYDLRAAYATGYIIGRYGPQLEEFMTAHPEVSVSLGNSVEVWCKTREELLDFIKLFGGTWSKDVSWIDSTKLTYTRQIDQDECGCVYGISLEAKDAPPPPSCRIEEVEELVPASVRKVKKLVCTPEDADDVPVKAEDNCLIDAEKEAASSEADANAIMEEPAS